MVLTFNTLRQYSPITQAGFELIILLPQLLGNWDYRPVPSLFSFLQIHVIQIGLKLHIQLRMALNFCVLGVPSCPAYLALVMAFVNHRQAFYQLRHTHPTLVEATVTTVQQWACQEGRSWGGQPGQS